MGAHVWLTMQIVNRKCANPPTALQPGVVTTRTRVTYRAPAGVCSRVSCLRKRFGPITIGIIIWKILSPRIGRPREHDHHAAHRFDSWCPDAERGEQLHRVPCATGTCTFPLSYKTKPKLSRHHRHRRRRRSGSSSCVRVGGAPRMIYKCCALHPFSISHAHDPQQTSSFSRRPHHKSNHKRNPRI